MEGNLKVCEDEVERMCRRWAQSGESWGGEVAAVMVTEGVKHGYVALWSKNKKAWASRAGPWTANHSEQQKKELSLTVLQCYFWKERKKNIKPRSLFSVAFSGSL